MKPAEIKRARQTLGLSQSQLAHVLGYGRVQRVSELECGVRNPSAAVRLLLTAYLDGYRPAHWPDDDADA